MYVRVIALKYSSKIDADAMTALAKYEMIHKLEGIISIEVIKINDLQSIAITKWHSKELAVKNKVILKLKFMQGKETLL